MTDNIDIDDSNAKSRGGGEYTPTNFDVHDWMKRVAEAKKIIDPVEQRKALGELVAEHESAEAWVREMARDIAYLRERISKGLNALDDVYKHRVTIKTTGTTGTTETTGLTFQAVCQCGWTGEEFTVKASAELDKQIHWDEMDRIRMEKT